MGVGVECIDKFVSDLKLTGEHFQKRYNRRNAMTATKRYNASRMYSCFRWRSNCKVALYAYFYPEKSEWRVQTRVCIITPHEAHPKLGKEIAAIG